MSAQTPARPDSAGIPSPPSRAPKNNTVKIVGIVVAGVVALGVVNAIAGDKPRTAAPSAATTVGTQTGGDSAYDLITAEEIVDIMKKSAVADFCTGYELIGDRDAYLEAFTQGYGEETVGPTSEEVFDEMLSRC